MGLNIKNAKVERLAAEVARLAGETKTEAIRRALEERKARLRMQGKGVGAAELRRFLEAEIWPKMPKRDFGREMSKEDEEKILGYSEDGA